MKKNEIVVGLSLLMLALVSMNALAVPVHAERLAKGTTGLPPFLYGDRIRVYDMEIELPANTPYYICHGVGWGDFSGLTPGEKQTIRDRETWVYELYIDGVQVNLRLCYHPRFDPATKTMGVTIWYCVQFDANTFEQSSTHVFVGKYYENGVLGLTLTLTVHFT